MSLVNEGMLPLILDASNAPANRSKMFLKEGDSDRNFLSGLHSER